MDWIYTIYYTEYLIKSEWYLLKYQKYLTNFDAKCMENNRHVLTIIDRWNDVGFHRAIAVVFLGEGVKEIFFNCVNKSRINFEIEVKIQRVLTNCRIILWKDIERIKIFNFREKKLFCI